MLVIKNGYKYFLLICLILTGMGLSFHPAFAQDKIPVREYTNPDEVVTFDRNTPFQRALDVFNDFSQKKNKKAIIDRTNTEGQIGIAVPPMHWREALDLILKVRELRMVENPDFFEIVNIPTGVPGSQAQRNKLADSLANTKTREIRINALFFEGNRRALQEIGVDWSTLTENTPEDVTSFVGTQQQGGGGQSGQLPSTSSGFDNHFVSVNTKNAQSVSQNVFNALINFGEIGETGVRVQALLNAFEADNLGEILANTSVKVIDGEEGRIQVGQDFSIKQRDFAGNVIDQFFSVGTILTVTPHFIEVNDTSFVHLDIEAERSSAQPDPVSTIINKQQATTKALLMDGEATAIAGLYRSETAEVRRGIPILKDLPAWFFGLRYLFGFNSKDRQMRELVILIQAELEPTIEERFGEFSTDKFTVLKDERQRFRKELDRSEETKVIDKEDTFLDKTVNEMTYKPENDSTTTENGNKPEENDASGQLQRESPENNGSANIKNEPNQEIVDPELKNEPVRVNLGSDPQNANNNDKTVENGQTGENDKKTGNQTKSEDINDGKSDTPSMKPKDVSQYKDDASDNANNKKKQPVTSQNREDHRYFVIGASFKNKANAEGYKQKLVKAGYSPVMLSKEGSDFYLVAYNSYNNINSAKSGLTDIRQKHNDQAWLYVKK